MVAHAVHETRRREVIGLDVGEPNARPFWTEFVRGGVARGRVGVQLAIRQAHEPMLTRIHGSLTCAFTRPACSAGRLHGDEPGCGG